MSNFECVPLTISYSLSGQSGEFTVKNAILYLYICIYFLGLNFVFLFFVKKYVFLSFSFHFLITALDDKKLSVELYILQNMIFENYLTFYSQEKTCFGVSFYAGLQVKFFNKRLQHTYFCGNIAIFLKASTLKNICECFIPLEPSQMFSSAGEVPS